jgi:hypothetical protein
MWVILIWDICNNSCSSEEASCVIRLKNTGSLRHCKGKIRIMYHMTRWSCYSSLFSAVFLRYKLLSLGRMWGHAACKSDMGWDSSRVSVSELPRRTFTILSERINFVFHPLAALQIASSHSSACQLCSLRVTARFCEHQQRLLYPQCNLRTLAPPSGLFLYYKPPHLFNKPRLRHINPPSFVIHFLTARF